jgi:aryl-alcohol dehydrogenase-like predicted oxidoreductase
MMLKETNMNSKLALGTVQFGIPYGVSNESGQINSREVGNILSIARQNGIDTLDTAISYGESEAVLGCQSLDGISIVTKLPEIPLDCNNIIDWVNSQIEGSLNRLNISSLDGVLLHKPHQLLGSFGDELYNALNNLKEGGLVNRIGISIYNVKELEIFCEKFKYDLIQAPFSVFDRRLTESGWLQFLYEQGTDIHVRSIFLQGLLLMNEDTRPAKFNRWNNVWNCWDDWLKETNQYPLDACLRYVLSRPEIEKVVVGVSSSSDLQEILESSNMDEFFSLPDGLSDIDEELLDPSNWSNL